MQNVFKFILNKLFGKSDLLQIAIIINIVCASQLYKSNADVIKLILTTIEHLS